MSRIEIHSPEKPAVAGRGWMVSGLCLFVAVLLAWAMAATRSGPRVSPTDWPLSFIPPPGFVPWGRAPLPFKSLLAYDGPLPGGAAMTLFVGARPMLRDVSPESVCDDTWIMIRSLSDDQSAVRIPRAVKARLDGRPALELGDLDTTGVMLRCAVQGDHLAFAAAAAPPGASANAAELFDAFCASIKIRSVP